MMTVCAEIPYEAGCPDMSSERILFITGRLAEPSLRTVVERLRAELGLNAHVEVLNITVAALLHAEWIARRLELREQFDRVIVPGWCQGDLRILQEKFGLPFERGPKDLFDLPEYLGGQRREPADLSRYDIEIVAEINHAPQWDQAALVVEAKRLSASGADVIDVGCIPGVSWSGIGDCVAMLRTEGLRVSIDSFDRAEVEAAVAAGAELVLSGNSTNLDWVSDLGCEVVAIPDTPADWESLRRTVAELSSRGTPFRIDPILEPIGFGFAVSLERYARARREWPDAEILMGIGNLTELTEVDSAGVNVVLAGYCQELGIRSVLTTQVINWCRSAVSEFDLARRLMKHACEQRVLPKHVAAGLVILRDAKLNELGDETLTDLASRVTDASFRVFAERGELHVFNREGYRAGTDPFEIFDEFLSKSPAMDARHAFYLGYELCKAITALTLGKQYHQDQALDWGFLTIPEVSAHERRRQRGDRPAE